jgi:hypothetical protein
MAYIEFEFSDKERFMMLVKMFNALNEAKRAHSFPNDDFWLSFLDEQARAFFWWPTERELQEWIKRWQATPVSQRFTDSTQLRWTFGSMLDAFQNGEYELVACTLVSNGVGRLEFEPLAWPYGGTGCIQALVEAFGCRVVKDSEAQDPK